MQTLGANKCGHAKAHAGGCACVKKNVTESIRKTAKQKTEIRPAVLRLVADAVLVACCLLACSRPLDFERTGKGPISSKILAK